MTRKERAHLNGMIRGIKIMAFGAVMAVMCIIGLLLFLRPETSTLEKRDLAKFPEFSWADFADGTWFKGIDTWYADTYPLREPMIAVSQKLESLYGIRGTQIVDAAGQEGNLVADAIPESGEGLEGAFPGDPVGPEQGGQLPAGGVQQGQEEVLHGDELVLHLPGGGLGPVEGLFGVGGDVDLPRLVAGGGHPGLTLHDILHPGGEGGQGDAHGGEKLGDEPGVVGQQGGQQVDLLDLGVAVLRGQGLGQPDGLGGFLGQFLSVHSHSHSFLTVSPFRGKGRRPSRRPLPLGVRIERGGYRGFYAPKKKAY